MFGCAAVVNVPVNRFADTTLAPVILPPPAPDVIKLPPTVALPETDNDVNVPVLVMFG